MPTAKQKPSKPQAHHPLSEACCKKVRLLREFLSDAQLQLWASNESDDVALWIACRECGRDTLLSKGS